MTTLTEGNHAFEFLVSEAPGHRSREPDTLISGQNLQAGTVLGRITKGSASAAADAGNTGNGAMGAITAGAGAKAGVYRLTIIEPAADAGAFQVEDPDGINAGSGNVGSAFSGGGLSFTLADGATDFVAGDAFDITVAAGSGKLTQYDQDGADGSEVADSILGNDCDASSADGDCVIVQRDAEVNASELIWPADIDAGEKTAAIAQLKDQGIIVR